MHKVELNKGSDMRKRSNPNWNQIKLKKKKFTLHLNNFFQLFTLRDLVRGTEF